MTGQTLVLLLAAAAVSLGVALAAVLYRKVG